MKKLIRLMVPDLGTEEINSLRKVLNSKYITDGPVTKLFEQKFARYVNAKNAVATTSGTTALELTLRVLKIKNGDEIVVPSFTHPATANCILSVGAKPIFVDIDLKTLNIDSKLLSKVISKKTKAIIAVSQFGNPLDYKPLLRLKKKHSLHLVEDAACSTGSKVNNSIIGSQADLSCFSFHPRKIITTGEGGMLVTNNAILYHEAQKIKNFGLIRKNNKLIQEKWGTNFKLTDIQSSIGIIQLKKIEKIIKNRIKKAKIYHDLFGSFKEIIKPSTQEKTRHTYQTYCILIKRKNQRDKLIQYLKKFNIESQIGTYALHLQPAFSKFFEKDLPNSRFAYENGLAIPLHSKLHQNEQHYIVNKITNFLK